MRTVYTYVLMIIALCAGVLNAEAKALYDKSHPLYLYVSPTPAPEAYPAGAIVIVNPRLYDAFVADNPTVDVRTWIDWDVTDAAESGGTVTATLEIANDTAILRIHGTGTAAGYPYGTTSTAMTKDTVPWYDVRGSIQKACVEEGVEHLGTYLLADMRATTTIILPRSLKSLYSSSLPRTLVGNVHSRAMTPPQMTMDLSADVDLKWSSATLHVPYTKSTTYQTTTGWNSFSSVIESEVMVVVVPAETVFNTQATIVCEVVPGADKYILKVWNDDMSVLLFHYEITWDTANNKWAMDAVMGLPGNAPKRMPIMHRDTVKGTTETMQIDITGLSPSSGYNYSVAAMSGSTKISESLGKFTTPNNKPTSIDTITGSNYQVPGRYNLLGMPVDENYQGVVIENGKRKLIIDK